MLSVPSQKRTAARVIALDIRPRRIGYTVFEGPTRLLDWGVIRIRHKKTDRTTFLLKTFRPSILVLRNITRNARRDRPAVREMTRTVRHQAKSLSIPSISLSTAQVKRVLGPYVKKPTKQQFAAFVAECLPELAWQLPPRRRVWQSERWNMTLFDSAALGLTYFDGIENTKVVASIPIAAEPFRRPSQWRSPYTGRHSSERADEKVQLANKKENQLV
jgi:hypothetical protein